MGSVQRRDSENSLGCLVSTKFNNYIEERKTQEIMTSTFKVAREREGGGYNGAISTPKFD